MSRNRGRTLLSLILGFVGVGSILVDFNSSHIFSPAWPPHARYHAVMLLTVWFGLAIVALWLLTSLAAVLVAALVPIFHWSTFLPALALWLSRASAEA